MARGLEQQLQGQANFNELVVARWNSEDRRELKWPRKRAHRFHSWEVTAVVGAVTENRVSCALVEH